MGLLELSCLSLGIYTKKRGLLGLSAICSPCELYLPLFFLLLIGQEFAKDSKT
jgi:hypothetical protein